MEQRMTGEGKWFLDILDRLSPEAEEIRVEGTPEQMTEAAAKAAYGIGTAAGDRPDAFEMQAIVPEVAALARLQVLLVYRIAAYHGKPEIVTGQFALLMLANTLGMAAGETFVRKAGTTLALKAMASEFVRKMTDKIGVDLTTEPAKKSLLRWIPVVTAPVFGLLARSLTQMIGREADNFFRRLEITSG